MWRAGLCGGVLERLDRVARERAPEAAYVWIGGDGAEQILRFGDLHDLAGAVAGELRPGVPAILFLPSGLEHPPALTGCLLAGAPAVSAHGPGVGGAGRLRAQVDALRERTGADQILTTAAVRDRCPPRGGERWIAVDELEGAEAVPASDASAPANEPAVLQFTSGSTGASKVVVMSTAGLLEAAAALERRCGMHAGDRIVSWLPPYHDLGLLICLAPVLSGAQTITMSPLSFLHRPSRWLQAAGEHRATVIAAPNFGYELCLRRVTFAERDALDLSSVEVACWGAEPARPATIEGFLQAFAPCGLEAGAPLNGYGMSEFGCLVSSQRRGQGIRLTGFDGPALEAGRAVASVDPDARRLASAGGPDELADLRIVDPATGQPVPDGHVGEVWIAGPSAALGYLHGDREAFAGRLPLSEESYLRTGDMGFFHDGEVYVCGRLKDVIIVRGRNLLPQEVEDAAGSADDALAPNSTIAFALEDGSRERLVVVQEVELRPGLDVDSLPDRIAGTVAEALGVRPDRVVLVPRGRLPRGNAGKVRRRVCRAGLTSGELSVLIDRETAG